MTYLLLLLVTAVVAWGGDVVVDPGLSIPLFLKIITYDENFDAKTIETVRIYTVYDQKTARSYEQLTKTEEFFKKNQDLTVEGVRVQLYSLTLDRIDSILENTSKAEYRMLIVTEIGREKARILAEKTKAVDVRSFALDPSYIPLGLAVTVRTGRTSNAILVNLEASRQEGSRFGAHLLKMCEIYAGAE